MSENMNKQENPDYKENEATKKQAVASSSEQALPKDDEANATGKNKKEKKKRTVWEEIVSWISLILTAVLLAGLIRGFIAEPIKVDGKSMINTLQNGEIVLVLKPEVLLDRLNRGDVVICHYPGRINNTFRLGATLTLESHVAFVKRLVALPGDTVAIKDSVLYVNDTAVKEDYIDFPADYDYPRRKLMQNEYFVIGDNRSNSHDSRASDVGPIPKEMIVGHAKFVIFPLNKIRTIH